MKKFLSTKRKILILVFGYFIIFAMTAQAAVRIPNPVSASNFGELLTKIADGIGTIVLSLGTVMVMVAGILYLTSAGSQERMAAAKKALTYAIIGILIGIFAKAIVATIQQIMS